MRQISKSQKETAAIAAAFLKKILEKQAGTGALVVGLSGDLGAGKTAFVKAVAKHLGVRQTVNSPTFVIIKKYKLPASRTHSHLVHIDAYRLKHEKEILALGWAELLKNPQHIIFVEWPENLKKALPRDARRIEISHVKEGHRHIKFA